MGPGCKEIIKHAAFLFAQIIKNEMLKKVNADKQMGKIARLQGGRQRIG